MPRRFQYPSYAAQVLQPTTAIPVYSYDSVALAYPYQVQYQAWTGTLGVFTQETITLDKWLGDYPDFHWRREPITVPFQTAFKAFTTEAITVDKWYAAPQPVPTRPRVHPARLPTMSPFQTIDFVAATSIDKWLGEYPDFHWRRRPIIIPFQTSFKAFADEIVTMDKWFVAPRPNPWKPKVHASRLPTTAYPHLTSFGETLLLDKWYAMLQPNPRTNRLHPSRHVTSVLQVPTSLFPVETITLDKWYVEHQPNPWRRSLHSAYRPERFLPQSVCFGWQGPFDPTGATWTPVTQAATTWSETGPTTTTWTESDEPCP